MQIKQFKIDNYHCLKKFNIEFNTISKKNGGSLTFLIGENGTGKSTMLKAILDIIISFDPAMTKSVIDYNFFIQYEYAHQNITIEKNKKYYTVRIDEQKIPTKTPKTISSWLSNHGRRIFPERIVAFYSGNNNVFNENIQKVNKFFSRNYKNNFEGYSDFIKSGMIYEPLKSYKRKYIYCDESFVPIYLIAILVGQKSKEKEIFQKKCGYARIRRVVITLTIDNEDYQNKRLNGLNINYKNEFKKKLLSIVEFIDSRLTSFFRNAEYYFGVKKKETIVINNFDQLNIDSIALLEFFDKLNIFFKTEYECFVENESITVSDRYLSEGQRQLIKILGMLGVCKSEDRLILMDEPDAHMNPRWKYEIREIIETMLNPLNKLEEPVNTQAIVATHDPLVINGASSKEIRIFERNKKNKYKTKVIKPDTNTKGMGIDGLLQSEYYGMRTSYDKDTTKEFERRQELYGKLIHKEISNEEKEELRKLTKEISSMPISSNTIDFIYDDFIREFRKTKYYTKQYLSSEDMKKRNEKIKEIIQTLYEK